jgi:GntR family transcriptional regulator / MocR family aminotransferase
MQETWATSAGLDLHIELSGTRPRAALESALRDAVRSGRLAAGTSLPSSRALAADLGLARNTVADAYGQLVAEGWLAARHGSGTWVAEQAAQLQAHGAAQARVAPAGARYSLRPGFPDVAAFPRAAWLAAARRALAAAPARSLTGYGAPAGLPVLRAELATYLARARGVSVVPERIVVCAGFSQGLELLCDLLRSRGEHTLAIEAYGHPAHRQVAMSAGMSLAPVPVDERGALAGGMPPPAGAGAVLLTPAHQFPLGAALAPERRRLAVDWAVAGNRLIIEDDYDGEFRYDRQAVGALQSLAPDHVVYAGTASKSLVPGLRLGWLAVPERLVGELTEIKRATSRLSSSLDQLALAEFISSGGYDRQVRRARQVYRQRRDRLVGELRRQVPGVTVTGIAAGLQVLIRLPAGVAEDDVITVAAGRGLALEGLASCRAEEPAGAGGPEPGPALIVGYATPPGHAFSTCVARLCAALRDVLGDVR